MINVIHTASVMNRAGQETLLMNILRNIDRSEVCMSFLCSFDEKGDYDSEIESLGAVIYHLPNNKLRKYRYFNYIGEIIAYYSFFSKHPEIQVFHMHTYHSFNAFIGIVGAKLARVSKIVVHSHNSNAPHRFLHFTFRPLLRILRIERFACSRIAANWLFGSCVNVSIINNGICLNDYAYSQQKREKVRNELGIGEEQILIGHIGRFNYQKNHIFLIEVFEEIHKKNINTILALVGVGELQVEIRRKIEEKKLSSVVYFLNVRDDIADLLSGFDVFLFPSLFEGLSVVLIEAQASDLPCIVSDANSIDVRMTDNIQMLSLSDSVTDWAYAVLNVVKSIRNSNDSIYRLRQCQYDISQTAKYLETKYLEWITQ